MYRHKEGACVMKKKPVSLSVPILFLITAVLWLIVFCNAMQSSTPWNWLTILQFLNIWVNLAAAVVNFVRYRRTREG